MSRELKRVPLDFNWPIGKKWEGYCPTIERFQQLFGEQYKFLMNYKHCGEICRKCEVNCGDCYEDADYCFWHNEENKKLWYKDVPEGKGYQLWSTTTEGHPMSPVFKTLDELCEHCEKEKVSVFADQTATKEEWLEMLKADFVHYKKGNAIFF